MGWEGGPDPRGELGTKRRTGAASASQPMGGQPATARATPMPSLAAAGGRGRGSQLLGHTAARVKARMRPRPLRLRARACPLPPSSARSRARARAYPIAFACAPPPPPPKRARGCAVDRLTRARLGLGWLVGGCDDATSSAHVRGAPSSTDRFALF